MMLFKHKKESPNETRISIEKRFIYSLNYVPPDYEHSPGFLISNKEALEEAREEVKEMSVIDPYMNDFRDPFIDAGVRCEQDSGRCQYTHHVGSILQITEEATEAKIMAESIQNEIDEALKKNEEKSNYYMNLLREKL